LGGVASGFGRSNRAQEAIWQTDGMKTNSYLVGCNFKPRPHRISGGRAKKERKMRVFDVWASAKLFFLSKKWMVCDPRQNSEKKGEGDPKHSIDDSAVDQFLRAVSHFR
jgi:hypothetical protein